MLREIGKEGTITGLKADAEMYVRAFCCLAGKRKKLSQVASDMELKYKPTGVHTQVRIRHIATIMLRDTRCTASQSAYILVRQKAKAPSLDTQCQQEELHLQSDQQQSVAPPKKSSKKGAVYVRQYPLRDVAFQALSGM